MLTSSPQSNEIFCINKHQLCKPAGLSENRVKEAWELGISRDNFSRRIATLSLIASMCTKWRNSVNKNWCSNTNCTHLLTTCLAYWFWHKCVLQSVIFYCENPLRQKVHLGGKCQHYSVDINKYLLFFPLVVTTVVPTWKDILSHTLGKASSYLKEAPENFPNATSLKMFLISHLIKFWKPLWVLLIVNMKKRCRIKKEELKFNVQVNDKHLHPNCL